MCRKGCHVRSETQLHRRGRRPVGRRREGEAGRRAGRAGRRGRPLSGRRQRRPHRGRGRAAIRPPPDPLGDPPRRRQVRGRQRRRARSRDLLRGARRARRSGDRCQRPTLHLGPCPRRAAVSQAARRGEREAAADRHHGAGHRARPTRTRSVAAASALPTSCRDTVAPDFLAERIERANAMLGHDGLERSAPTWPSIWPSSSAWQPVCGPWRPTPACWSIEALRDGRRVLLEGAQGALLDVDHGTYPVRDLLEHHGRWRGHRRRHRPDGD